MKIALIGASGYGTNYFQLIERFLDLNEYILAGVVDPFWESSQWLDWLNRFKIRQFTSIELNDTA